MKKEIKKELLKMLSNDMKEMIGDERKGLFGKKDEDHDEDCPMCEDEDCPGCDDEEGGIKKKMKVMVAGDSPEAIKEGLSKAEEIMKMKLGDKK